MQNQPVPGMPTVSDFLTFRAAQDPNRLALRVERPDRVEDWEDQYFPVTYGQLHAQAAAVAASLLQASSFSSESQPRVLVATPPGVDFIASLFGCFLAGAVAVPIHPPTESTRHQRKVRGERWDKLLADANPSLVLTDAPSQERVQKLLSRNVPLMTTNCASEILAMSNSGPETEGSVSDRRPGSEPRSPGIDSECLDGDGPRKIAFLQYTSGSTGDPKGVIVTHDNLSHNLEQIRRRFRHDETSRGVIWLPPFHDMGLIGGILQPIYAGFPVLLMDPASFIRNPFRWLEAISRFRGTTSGGPSFAYEYAVRRISKQRIEDLDLSCWSVAFVGAEAVRASSLNRFAKTFECCGFSKSSFLPCYGLAEATLMVSGDRISDLRTVSISDAPVSTEAPGHQLEGGSQSANSKKNLVDLVPNGTPVDDLDIRIVDPETRRECPREQVGEIWVAGPSVANGYWNRTKETKETFGATLVQNSDPESNQVERSFLRTGDLGSIQNGEIVICGRIKDLIVIRGQNFYPPDLERCLEEEVPGSVEQSTAVFSVEDDHAERLIVLFETRKAIGNQGNSERLQMIRAVISHHYSIQVQTIVGVKTGSLPRTTSGKIRRRACREDFLAGNLARIVSWSAPADLSPSSSTESMLPDENVASPQAVTSDQVRDWLVKLLAARLGVSPADVSPTRPLAELGIDSLTAVEIADAMTQKLQLAEPLQPTIAWSYPTIDALIAHVCSKAQSEQDPALELNDAGSEGESAGDPNGQDQTLKPVVENLPAPLGGDSESIAIVGIACRFPGNADSPEAFWELLRGGVDAVTEVPPDRWDVDAYYDSNPETPGKMYTRAGAFLDRIGDFDPEFFGISPREAAHLDPQQRLLLESSYLALADAGFDPLKLQGSNTAVFVGMTQDEYAQRTIRSGDPIQIHPHSALGTSRAVAAGRIAYEFGLQGPAIQLDTTCSSSLVAVHAACQSLRTGEAESALAGGVNLILSPESSIACCKLQALSPDGRCYTFSDRANGYVRGEGCAMIVLQRVSDAIAESRPIYGIIRGSAVNHDGVSNGLTAPNGNAQVAVVRRALEQAKMQPSQIDYVEAHGTATPLGDPIELESLSEVFGDRDAPLLVGSVKTNIGHLESAAGIASLIKVVLAMQQGIIPAHLQCSRKTKQFNWSQSSIQIARTQVDWPRQNNSRSAGVSSFGMSGTNAHVIVELPDSISRRASWEHSNSSGSESHSSPFKRQRFWIEYPELTSDRSTKSVPVILNAVNEIPLGGTRMRCFDARVGQGTLSQHQVCGAAILPATVQLWLAGSAFQRTGQEMWQATDVRFWEAACLSDSEDSRLQIQIVPEAAEGSQFELYQENPESWVLKCCGRIDGWDGSLSTNLLQYEMLQGMPLESGILYSRFRERGIDYGPQFQLVDELVVAGDLAISRVSLSPSRDFWLARLWDAGLQSAGALFEPGRHTLVPVAFERFAAHQAIPFESVQKANIIVRRRQDCVDILWLSRERVPVAEAIGLQVAPFDPSAIDKQNVHTTNRSVSASVDLHGSPYFELCWEKRARPQGCGQFFRSPRNVSDAAGPFVEELFSSSSFKEYETQVACWNDRAKRYFEMAVANVPESSWVEPYGALRERAKTHSESKPTREVRDKTSRFETAPEDQLVDRVGSQLMEIVAGKKDAMSVLFPEGSTSLLAELYESSPTGALVNSVVSQVLRTVFDSKPDRPLRVLEVGAGTGGTTSHVIEELQNAGVDFEYHFTDVSRLLLNQAEQRFSHEDLKLKYSSLDIEESPATQGFGYADFDLVIAANVVHATRSVNESLQHVRQLLADDGLLLLVETTTREPWLDLVFGVTDGWWRFKDHELRPDHALVAEDQWRKVCLSAGFSDVEVLAGCVVVAQQQKSASPARPQAVALADEVIDVRQLASKETIMTLPRVCSADLGSIAMRNCTELLQLVQSVLAQQDASNRRVIVVASNDSAADRLIASACWGLLQTISIEHPELKATLISSDSPEASWDEICNGGGELRIDLRDGQRAIAKLEQATIDLNGMKATVGEEDCKYDSSLAQEQKDVHRLVSDATGTLEGLQWKSVSRRMPVGSEVEIEVHKAGLNFRDVLIAMGIYPDPAELGCECVGVVSRYGPGVTDLQVGERVAVISSGCFANYVVAPRALVVPVPSGMDASVAASLPVAFATAILCLRNLARLEAGDSVLWHTATGAVGQAAIQVARSEGARIIASASRKKWSKLKELGVEDVVDSRSLEFVNDVRRMTQGKGVQIAVNCLPGEFRRATLDVVAHGGSFIEIGKGEGLTAEEINRLRPDVKFESFDLSKLCLTDEEAVANSLSLAVENVRTGRWRAPEVCDYDFVQAGEAFRTMQQAKHTGKLLLDFGRLAPSNDNGEERLQPADNSVVLITGGLGGLGLMTAQWLVERGEKHLVLLSRKGVVSEQQKEVVDRIRNSGVIVDVLTVDVSDADQLATALKRFLDGSGPSLRGVIHAAGVLADHRLEQQTEETFQEVFKPKAIGAWNLHELTKDLSLEYFILFSSAAGVFGAPGQANHAVANSFLDGLVQYRASSGLPALSIAWGPWAEMGAATRYAEQGELRGLPGVELITPDEGIRCLQEIFSVQHRTIVVLPIDRSRLNESRWVQNVGFEIADDLIDVSSSGIDTEPLIDFSDGKELGAYLRESLGQTLGMAPDSIDSSKGFFEMGLDSLTALELKNRLERDLRIELPSTIALDYPTLDALQKYLSGLMFEKSEIAEKDAMDEQNVADELDRKLNELDDYFRQ